MHRHENTTPAHLGVQKTLAHGELRYACLLPMFLCTRRDLKRCRILIKYNGYRFALKDIHDTLLLEGQSYPPANFSLMSGLEETRTWRKRKSARRFLTKATRKIIERDHRRLGISSAHIEQVKYKPTCKLASISPSHTNQASKKSKRALLH